MGSKANTEKGDSRADAPEAAGEETPAPFVKGQCFRCLLLIPRGRKGGRDSSWACGYGGKRDT